MRFGCKTCGLEVGHWAGCPSESVTVVLEEDRPERQLDNKENRDAAPEDQGSR